MKNQPRNNRFKKIFRWIIRVVIFQLILINISAAFHAYRITHYYNDDRVRNLPTSSGTFFLRTWRLMVGRKFSKSQIVYYPPGPYDSVQLFTSSKNKIDGWWMKADSAIGTVILFHGLSSNKGFALNEANEFLAMGYNTLLIDFRAHGQSGGIACTIGMKEAEEVKLAYDYVKSKGEKNIILWGMSMGAVSITRAVYDYNILPQKIILEMPFERLQDHIRARARVFGFPNEPFGFFVTFWTGLEQGYWGFGHQTTKYVRQISCPVLLQWGAKDEYVLKKETENIFKNISSKKTLIEYPEAGHVSLLNADTEKWRNAVAGFLKNP